jgi:hypothetical protein
MKISEVITEESYNYRFKANKKNGVKEIWCYVVKEDIIP